MAARARAVQRQGAANHALQGEALDRYLSRLAKDGPTFSELAGDLATARDRHSLMTAARRVLATQPSLNVTDLAIDGGDLKLLGLEPGPRYGEILRALLDRVIDNPELNERDTLTKLASELASQS